MTYYGDITNLKFWLHDEPEIVVDYGHVADFNSEYLKMAYDDVFEFFYNLFYEDPQNVEDFPDIHLDEIILPEFPKEIFKKNGELKESFGSGVFEVKTQKRTKKYKKRNI